MECNSLWSRATDPSLLKRHYSDSTVAMGLLPVATMTPNSDIRADVIHLSLLGSTLVMDKLASAHPSLVDRNLHSISSSKHILHSVSERKHNLHSISERKHNLIIYIYMYIYNTELIYLITYIYTEFIHLIQFASSSTKAKQKHQVQQKS
jgi:hypothetical protein